MFRILNAVAEANQEIGYVQGINFIGAALLYHCGEAAAYYLFMRVIQKYDLASILRPGMKGLDQHNAEIDSVVKHQLSDLYSHF